MQITTVYCLYKTPYKQYVSNLLKETLTRVLILHANFSVKPYLFPSEIKSINMIFDLSMAPNSYIF